MSKKYIPSPGGMLPNGTIYEQIRSGQTVQYAIKTDKGVVIVPFLEVGEHIVYQPLTPPPWNLPPAPTEYESVELLWDEIKKFVQDHLDIENTKLYHVFVAWVFASWIPEKFDSIGYLHFHGPRNSGKTRGLDILNYLCFRPLESPSASGATIFRAMDAYHPTFLLDEFEMYQKQQESKAEVIGIINAGYRRGQVVLRMTGMKEGNPMIKGFRVFGPKAISSIEPLPDALESRCIRFPMTKSYRKLRRLIDKERAEQLRGKLLQYRFSHDLTEPMSENNPVNLPDGRLIEMFYPLEAVAPTQEIKDTILTCGREQYDTSIEEDRASTEARVFNVVLELLNDKVRLQIPQYDVREKYNATMPESEKLEYRTLGKILKTLNFKKKFNSRTRKTEVVVDADLLERRKNTYVLSEEMERIDAVIAEVRKLQEQLKAGQQQLNQQRQQRQQYQKGQEGVSIVDKPPETEENSKNTVDNADIVDIVDTFDIVDFSLLSLQEQLEWMLGELSCAQDGASATELAEKSGMDRTHIDKLLSKLGREGRAFSPRLGYWKIAS